MSGTAQFVAAKGQIQAFDTGSSLLMSDYFTASGSFSNPFPSENSLSFGVYATCKSILHPDSTCIPFVSPSSLDLLWFPTVFSIISYPMSLF
jgi:hypothetical protein